MNKNETFENLQPIEIFLSAATAVLLFKFKWNLSISEMSPLRNSGNWKLEQLFDFTNK